MSTYGRQWKGLSGIVNKKTCAGRRLKREQIQYQHELHKMPKTHVMEDKPNGR